MVIDTFKNHLLKNRTIKTVEEYNGDCSKQFEDIPNVYMIRRQNGFKLNFIEINNDLKEVFGWKIEVLEYNNDGEDFIVVKLINDLQVIDMNFEQEILPTKNNPKENVPYLLRRRLKKEINLLFDFYLVFEVSKPRTKL